MSLDTYTGLKAEIADWLDRPDLTARIDTFIDLCEARMSREVRHRSMLRRATAVLETDTKYLALPTGFRGMKIMRLMTTPVTVLEQINEYEMTKRMADTSGLPIWFSIHEEIEFERVPDSDYSAEMIYYAALTPLGDDVDTQTPANAILTYHPDLYLYGSLLAAEPFLDNDERVPTWEKLYAGGVQTVNDEDKRSRTSGPQIAKVSGDTP